MSRVLRQISRSSFFGYIENAKLPHHFIQPTFKIKNGKTDQVEHISHFNQRMAIHSKNEAFMCKVFPLSLGSTTMRWFDGLELTWAFGAYKVLRRIDMGIQRQICHMQQSPQAFGLLALYGHEGWRVLKDIFG